MTARQDAGKTGTDPPPPGRHRLFYLALGWAALILGLIGAVLPIMPTTVFMIVAAFAFGRASPRLRRWLITHPLFGPPIRDWEDRGAISRPAKFWSVVAMVWVLLLSWLFGVPGWVLLVQVVVLGAVAAFILTRPD